MFSADAMSLKAFSAMLPRLPRPVLNEVRKSNRHYAAKLRTEIRAKAPFTKSAGNEGPRHDTRHNAIKRSIQSRASATYAFVRGGNAAAPHFMVHEFGGSVFWTKAKSSKSARDMFGHKSSKQIAERLSAHGVKGHVIPGRRRLPSVSSPLGGGKHGAGSYFFFRTADLHVPKIQDDATDAAADVIRRMLS
jgi:hypothetical protein